MNQKKELVWQRNALLNIPVLYDIVITEAVMELHREIKPYNKTEELIILNKFQTLIEELEERAKCL